ncbi:MAG: ABC transporter ATP-binding protein [Alphaproteobacteria bacterium]
MSAIVLAGVSKEWSGTRVLDDVSFAAEPGSLVVLLGPSGCGKSTTLRLIAGLDTVSAGRIEIAGRDVTGEKPARRNVAMVFQSYALFPHLSVRENILFGLKARRVAAAERERRLARAAGILGLEALLERRPAQLSGGQQQRVALGRAIVAETPVCLMDEPLSNLDAQLRGEMRREIRALQQRLGITMVYVTHDQVEAMTMADQVILLNQGRIEQAGPPEALYGRPETVFAARFIGTPPMNVVAPAGIGVADGPAGALLGVRPEAVAIAGEGVSAEVASVEYLGADSLIETRAAGETLFAKAEGRSALRPGDAVRLAWRPDDRHWFDAETGIRLQ